MNATGAFRVPTNGKGQRYWFYPKVACVSLNGIVLHEAVDDPELFTVTHETTGLALLQAAPRSVADVFFADVSTWPEWESITHKAQAQPFYHRVLRARFEAQVEGRPEMEGQKLSVTGDA